MKYFIILVLVVMCSYVQADCPQPPPPGTYQTSICAIFTQVNDPKFGSVWKDPSGTAWSSNQGDYTNIAIKPDQNFVVIDSLATEACAKIGGDLPTLDDYQKLLSYVELDLGFPTAKGWKDLYALFPDMRAGIYWTVSVWKEYPAWAVMFSGSDGNANAFGSDTRYLPESVRCLHH